MICLPLDRMKKDTTTEHGGPVVIVTVSDDSENNNNHNKVSSPLDICKYDLTGGDAVVTVKDDQQPHLHNEDEHHQDEAAVDRTSSNNAHSVLCKYNSYPQPDKSPTNHLRVPSTCNVSTCETDSSVYSSNEELAHRDGEFALTASDCQLDRISCCSVPPPSNITTIDSIERHHSFSDSKIQQKCLNPVIFQHKPLTRAVSAPPLKSNELSMLSIENGFIHNKRSNTQRHQEKNSASKMSLFIPPKVFKNAVKRVRSAEPPRVSSNSTFSLRRTVSNSIRGWSNQSSSFITFPSKNKKKPPQRYKIVEAKTGQRDGLSFELVGKQGTFLRVKGSILISDKDTSDSHFNKDCTFVPLPDMWFPSFFAFESVSKPSYFLRLTTSHGELVLEKYDCTKDFKEEASFQLNRKPCATCLQVGIQTWAKKSSGEFCLGKVVSIKNDMVEVKFTDGRTLLYPMSDTSDLVPDIIPSADDILIGTKVIAQWLSRNKLYAGVVSGIRGGDTYEVLFDDGDVCREKAFQLRLVRAYFLHYGSDGGGANVGDMCHIISNNCHEDSDKCCRNTDDCLEKTSVTHTNSNDSDICVDDKTSDDDENTHARLSYSYSNPDFPEILSAGHSSTIIDENGFTSSHSDNKQQYPYNPWEIETFSQDSGYHGYDKQNTKDNKIVGVKFCISEHHYHDDIDCTSDFHDVINKDLQDICRKLVRSKSMDDVESELNYRLRQMRRTKSLSFKNVSSSFNASCTAVLVK